MHGIKHQYPGIQRLANCHLLRLVHSGPPNTLALHRVTNVESLDPEDPGRWNIQANVIRLCV